MDIAAPSADAEYRWREIPPDAPKEIVAALELSAAPSEIDAARTVRVIRAGTPVPWPDRGQLVLEDGRSIPVADCLPGDLPLGYHDFFPAGKAWKTRVIVTPWECPAPAAKQWGFSVQLHAVRSAESWGIGDLADLRRLAAWAAGLKADLLLINPLGGVAPVVPQADSPYYPASRRFRNPLYLCVEEMPGAERMAARLAPLAAAGRALGAKRLIDRDAVFRLKRAAFAALWADFAGDADFEQYCRREGEPLVQFALYCALAERFGGDWRQWPAEYRRPTGPAACGFAKGHPAELRFHQWLQWQLDCQLARARRTLPLVHDLPIGFDPGGADAWTWQDLLAKDCEVGAPADAFNPRGQNWQLPAFVPWKLRAAAYEPFIQTIRAAARHAAGLRIDHVMGLFRLFWIPRGAEPARGAYVRYPADDLLGIVALESRRAGALVIGEDLGTVEPGVRERLAARKILSCRLLWFEPDKPAAYPPLTMAAATTHDLPTVAGLWTGSDLAAQRAAGLATEEEMKKLRRHHARLTGLGADAPVERVIETTYRLLGDAPSAIFVASLEDALAVEERANMPGTTAEWPNWRLALPGGLEALASAPLARRIAAALTRH